MMEMIIDCVISDMKYKFVSINKCCLKRSSRQEYYPWGMTPQRSIADTLVMGRQDEGS